MYIGASEMAFASTSSSELLPDALVKDFFEELLEELLASAFFLTVTLLFVEEELPEDFEELVDFDELPELEELLLFELVALVAASSGKVTFTVNTLPERETDSTSLEERLP